MRYWMFNGRGELVGHTTDRNHARLSCVLRTNWWYVSDEQVDRGILKPNQKAQVLQCRQQLAATATG